MPVITLPRVGVELATVTGVTVLVSIRCRCGTVAQLGLINAQPALCESCGRVFTCDAVEWAKDRSVPHVSLSSSPSRADLLSS